MSSAGTMTEGGQSPPPQSIDLSLLSLEQLNQMKTKHEEEVQLLSSNFIKLREAQVRCGIQVHVRRNYHKTVSVPPRGRQWFLPKTAFWSHIKGVVYYYTVLQKHEPLRRTKGWQCLMIFCTLPCYVFFMLYSGSIFGFDFCRGDHERQGGGQGNPGKVGHGCSQ